MSPDEEDGYMDLSEEVESAIGDELKGDSTRQIIEIRDASTEVAKVLPPQLGTDPDMLRDGFIDVRRFTNIHELDAYWLSWFSLKTKEQGGGFTKKFCEEFANWCYSINAQNKKMVVAMQQAVSGADKKEEKPKDSRSWIQKHLTQRGKEPEELYDVS